MPVLSSSYPSVARYKDVLLFIAHPLQKALHLSISRAIDCINLSETTDPAHTETTWGHVGGKRHGY